jgi:hypothetical protein
VGVIVPAYIARYNRLLSRLTSTRGEPLEGLAPELIPILLLEGPAADPRYASLAEDRMAAGFSFLAASAGNFGVSKIANPAGSGILILLELVSVQLSAGNADIFTTSLGEAGFSAPLTTVGFRDARVRGAAPAAHLVNQNNVSQTGGRFYRIPGPTVGREVALPFVIPPGFEVGICNDTVNASSNHSYAWRERALEAGELGQ